MEDLPANHPLYGSEQSKSGFGISYQFAIKCPVFVSRIQCLQGFAGFVSYSHSMVAGGLGVSVLSAFSLAGYEGQVRVIPLTQPVSRRLGVAVKAPPAANTAARYFLSFLKRQYAGA